MKILVTGATGFLGTALCRRLAKEGHSITEVHSKNCDLTREDSLDQFQGERFDQIYHLAAWTQAGDFCLRHPGDQWIMNQKINTHLLCWWKERQPQAKLISIGTSCAYDPALELKEENYLLGCPIESLFTYAMTKRMLYTGQLAFHRQYGLQYLCVVPSTLYGPGYHTDGRQMHFIFDLIRKILHAQKKGERVTLWGDGHQRRELVYIDDFVDTLVQLNSTVSNALINIGSGEEYSIRRFAEKICAQTGFNTSHIDFDETKYVGARSKILSITYLHSLLPTRPMTTLEQGLEATIGWIKQAGIVR